jgi:hypothetical protein
MAGNQGYSAATHKANARQNLREQPNNRTDQIARLIE